MARNYQDIIDAQKALRSRQQDSGILGYPPGYTSGGALTVGADYTLTIDPLIANVAGKSIKISDSYILNDNTDWLTDRVADNWYYLYLTDDGIFKVDSIAPSWSTEYWADYHPILSNYRNMGKFFLDSSKHIVYTQSKAPQEVSDIFTLPFSSTNYTIEDNDGLTDIFVTTAATDRTITLPTAADNQGRELFIKKIDSGAGDLIVDGEGSEKINQTLTWQGVGIDAWLWIISDGTGWFIKSHNGGIIEFTDTTQRAISSPAIQTWYNPTGHQITLEPGVWDVEYDFCLFVGAAACTYLEQKVTLSTANNSESDVDFTSYCVWFGTSGATSQLKNTFHKKKQITVSAQDVYYLNVWGDVSSGTIAWLRLENDVSTGKIQAWRVK
jgi:hypothetical protein